MKLADKPNHCTKYESHNPSYTYTTLEVISCFITFVLIKKEFKEQFLFSLSLSLSLSLSPSLSLYVCVCVWVCLLRHKLVVVDAIVVDF